MVAYDEVKRRVQETDMATAARELGLTVRAVISIVQPKKKQKPRFQDQDIGPGESNTSGPCVICGAPSAQIGFFTMKPYCSESCYRSMVDPMNPDSQRHENRYWYVQSKLRIMSTWHPTFEEMSEKVSNMMTIRQFVKALRQRPGAVSCQEARHHALEYAEYISKVAPAVSPQRALNVLLTIWDDPVRVMSGSKSSVPPPLPWEIASRLELWTKQEEISFYSDVYKETKQALETTTLSILSGTNLAGQYALANREIQLNPLVNI